MKKLLSLIFAFIGLLVVAQAQTSTTFTRSVRYGTADSDSVSYSSQNLWWYGPNGYRFSEAGTKYSLKSYLSTFGSGWPLTGSKTLTGAVDIIGAQDLQIGTTASRLNSIFLRSTSGSSISDDSGPGETYGAFNASGLTMYYNNGSVTSRLILDGNGNTFTGKLFTEPPVSGTLAGFNLGTISGDPSSTVNADLWLNSSTNKLRAKINGTSQNIATEAYVTSAVSGGGFVPTSRTVNGHALTANVTVTKSDVGLGSVDNTSDAGKPVSTAQQTAIDAKVEDAINNGTTTVAPSENAVFDALALKSNVLIPSNGIVFSGDSIQLGGDIIKQTTVSTTNGSALTLGDYNNSEFFGSFNVGAQVFNFLSDNTSSTDKSYAIGVTAISGGDYSQVEQVGSVVVNNADFHHTLTNATTGFNQVGTDFFAHAAAGVSTTSISVSNSGNSTGLFLSTANGQCKFIDLRSTKSGIEYNATGYVTALHSLADKEYVDARKLTATATLDFPSTLSTAVSDLTITVTGAATSDPCVVGAPNGSVTATATYTCWVSATNTVKVRFSPKATEDPASGSFKVSVFK